MRHALILFIPISLLFIAARPDNNKVFTKHTDVAEEGLKGKIKSIVTYDGFLDDSTKHYSVYIRRFNAAGFRIESLDTLGKDYYSYKYFYNRDGLLEKVICSLCGPFPPYEETYSYSLKERKKTAILTYKDSLGKPGRSDTFISVYDVNGNLIEDVGRAMYVYDKHGFLTAASGTNFVNDNKGRKIKTTWVDGRGTQTFVYDKNGNEIQKTSIIDGKRTDYLTGYCEFDSHGNFLKSISVCPQTKDFSISQRVIEYY